MTNRELVQKFKDGMSSDKLLKLLNGSSKMDYVRYVSKYQSFCDTHGLDMLHGDSIARFKSFEMESGTNFGTLATCLSALKKFWRFNNQDFRAFDGALKNEYKPIAKVDNRIDEGYQQKTGEELAVLKYRLEKELHELSIELSKRISGHEPVPKQVEVVEQVTDNFADLNDKVEPANPPMIKCETCGKPFPYSKHRGRVKRFCSANCYGAWYRKSEQKLKADNENLLEYERQKSATESTKSTPLNQPKPDNEISGNQDANSRKCKQCGNDLPSTANPSRIFCDFRCGQTYHKALQERLESRGDNVANVQLPLYTHDDPKPELQYTKKHQIIFELLKIAGITISSKGYYVFSGKLYSSRSDFDDLAALIPTATPQSVRRVNVVNRYMKMYLGAVVMHLDHETRGSCHCVEKIQTDLLTDDDKLVIMEMQADSRKKKSQKVNRASGFAGA